MDRQIERMSTKYGAHEQSGGASM